MSDLTLHVKRIYFDSIRIGTKGEEYRLATPYWTKRLVGREYDRVVIKLGYPPAGDIAREMSFEYRGYRKTKITHPHFGTNEVEVYAIDLCERIA